MRLAKDGNNLWYLKTELSVLVGERGSMTTLLFLPPLGRVRPDLDALPGKRSPSPARRTVPDIQKPPLPIRSTIGAPLK
jgi:hypothetical protein